MRILVTGGAGFIGSRLAAALRARGHAPVVLDDLSTGHRANVPAGCAVRTGDVRRARDVAAALEGVEQVYHLAAAVGPGLVASDPGGTWSRNVRGTRMVLAACAGRGLPVLFASSSEVYHPRVVARGRALRETDRVGFDPADRRSVYARSKLAGERLALGLGAAGLPVVVARLFNVVGPGQSPRHGMVLARFVAAARRGAPLVVYGDGNQRRCFLHVADAVDALTALMAGAGRLRGPFNVGGTEEVSVGALATRVRALAGSRSPIVHMPVEVVYGTHFGDPRVRRPDTTRLGRATGWRACRRLDDAVREALSADRRPTPRRGCRPPAAVANR
jgi:UDP-glucose 4-epimerase